AKERNSTDEVSKLFNQTLALRITISLALFLPVAILIVLYVSLFSLTVAGAWAIAILTLSLLPGALSGSITAVLYAYERMSLPAAIGVATSVVNVALGIAALLLGWGIVGLALASTLSTLLTAALFGRVLKQFWTLDFGFWR